MGFGGAVKRAAAMSKQERMARERAVLGMATTEAEPSTSESSPAMPSKRPNTAASEKNFDAERLGELEHALQQKDQHLAKLKTQVQSQQIELSAMLTGQRPTVTDGECAACKLKSITHNSEISSLQNDFLHSQATLEAKIKQLEEELTQAASSAGASVRIEELENEVAGLHLTRC